MLGDRPSAKTTVKDGVELVNFLTLYISEFLFSFGALFKWGLCDNEHFIRQKIEKKLETAANICLQQNICMVD